MRSRAVVVLVALISFGISTAASAQYFGRNKVQYERFDFQVMNTEHFDIYYYPEEEAAVKLAARMAERWYARLSKLLQHELRGRQPLILYAAHPHFQQTNVLSGEIGEGTGGVTESAKRRVILPFAGGLAETDHVLGHELVHAFQYDLAAQTDLQGRPIGPGLQALPLWFIEGMAEYLSIGPIDANTAMWVREASARNAMPTIDRLDDPDFFPLDGLGFNEVTDGHNFHFTTEIHVMFSYQLGQRFTFRGDDDLWIFVNGRLALDVGGLHQALEGTIDFDAQAAALGIMPGGRYRMDIFHAERQTLESNFRIETNISCFEPSDIE